jgi:perosamine synthetase
MIRFAKPYTPRSVLTQLEKAFDNGMTGYSPIVIEFENMLKSLIGCKHVIATNSGTSALFLAQKALIHESTDVLSPALTMEATNLSILHANNRIIFGDVDRTSYCLIDNERIANKVVVWYGGIAHCKPYKGHVIEDCAQAFMSRYDDDKVVGNSNNLCCFSTQAVKLLQTGDGGFITTNDDALAEKLRLLVYYGVDHNDEDKKKYLLNRCVLPGYKMHMNTTAAVMGIEQLKEVDSILDGHRRVYQYYLDNINSALIPNRLATTRSNYSNFTIEVDDNRKFVSYMLNEGVQCAILWRPSYRSPCFVSEKVALSNTEHLFKRVVSLPCYYRLTEDEIKYIVKCVNGYVVL